MYSNKVRVVETSVFYSGVVPLWHTGRPHKKYCFFDQGDLPKVTQVQHLSVPEELGFLMWKWRRRICQCAKSLLTYILTTQNQSRLPARYPCHRCRILVFTQSSTKLKHIISPSIDQIQWSGQIWNWVRKTRKYWHNSQTKHKNQTRLPMKWHSWWNRGLYINVHKLNETKQSICTSSLCPYPSPTPTQAC